jgi:hypothetical protein
MIITDHAVGMFRKRIRHLQYQAVLEAIRNGLKNRCMAPVVSNRADGTWIVRIRARRAGEYDFRAILSSDLRRVLTIYSSGRSRKGKNNGS